MGMWGRKDHEDERPATGTTPSSAQPAPAARSATPATGEQRSAAPGQSRRAIIGPSIQVKGELIGREDLVIEGYVEGVVRLKDHQLTIGETADVHATLEAKALRVEGKVDGDIVATERVELASGSTVLGDIKSPRISIADGARFKGSVDMEQPAPAGGSASPKAPATPASKPASDSGNKPAAPEKDAGSSPGKGSSGS